MSGQEKCPECGAAWNPRIALTPRQREAWVWIQGYVEEHGVAPSFAEIAAGIGVSSIGYVHELIERLERKGVLRKGPRNVERGLQVLQEAPGGGS